MDLVEPSTPLPHWFTEDDLACYTALYENSGFSYPLQMPYRLDPEQIQHTVFIQQIRNHDNSDLLRYLFIPIVIQKTTYIKFPGKTEEHAMHGINNFCAPK